jgi:predicted PurR-regulated permease PerM
MWQWLWNQIQQGMGYFDPYRLVLTALIGLLWFLVRNLVKSQTDIAHTLNNHLTEIRQGLEDIHTHMATSNEILGRILDKVLDAALRNPERVLQPASQVRESLESVSQQGQDKDNR